MYAMKDEDFKKLLLIATTIENLRALGMCSGNYNSTGVMEKLYGDYEEMKKYMSPQDLLAFAEFVKGDKNV